MLRHRRVQNPHSRSRISLRPKNPLKSRFRKSLSKTHSLNLTSLLSRNSRISKSLHRSLPKSQQNQNQQKPKAEAKPAEKPVENKPVEAKQKPAQPKVETKVEPKVEPKSETKVEAKTEPVQTTEAKAEKTYTSHLGNEVKRTRRPERKPQHTENLPQAELQCLHRRTFRFQRHKSKRIRLG